MIVATLTQNTTSRKLFFKCTLNLGHLLSKLEFGLLGLLVQFIDSFLFLGSL